MQIKKSGENIFTELTLSAMYVIKVPKINFYPELFKLSAGFRKVFSLTGSFRPSTDLEL